MSATVNSIRTSWVHPGENNPEKYFDEGQKYKLNGELLLAAEKYRDALNIDPKHAWSMHCLAQTMYWLGELDEAIECYKNACELLPESESWVAYFQLADVYLKVAEFELAISSLEVASELSRNSPEVAAKQKQATKHVVEQIAVYFDVEFYRKQCHEIGERQIKIYNPEDAAIHFLYLGKYKDLNPHWIFDAPFIQEEILRKPTDEVISTHWFFTFIARIGSRSPISPNCIYDLEYLRENSPEADLAHDFQVFVSNGCYTDCQTSALFSPQYYTSSVEKISGPIGLSSFLHFHENLGNIAADPHPAFHSGYYCEQVGPLDIHPLKHYLCQEGFKTYSPNPLLDLDSYRRCNSEVDFETSPAFIHFLENPEKYYAIPGLDLDFYRQSYSGADDELKGAVAHLSAAGVRDWNIFPFEGFSTEYIRRTVPANKFNRNTECFRYFADGCNRRQRIVVVSHSASRTGAPLIALEIVKQLSGNRNYELFSVLFGDGPLVEDFRKYSHVLNTQNPYGADHNENMRVANTLMLNRPDFAFINSAESRHFAKYITDCAVPTVSLIHEIADHYSSDEWRKIFDVSRLVIFPAKYVKQRSDMKLGKLAKSLTEIPQAIIPQGLLVDNFGKYEKQTKRKSVRKGLSISDEEIVILGCGTVDLRKGVDLFVDCAIKLLAEDSTKQMRFLWVGKKSELSDNQSVIYWKLKTCSEEIVSRIHFIDEVSDTEPYYCASDIFLLTSRSDPLPCVMHEALSSGLPVVFMHDSGGASEMIDAETGVGVEYENVDQMCDAIRMLSRDHATRSSLGFQGVKRIEINYCFEDYVNKILKSVCQENILESDAITRISSSIGSKLATGKRKIYFLTPDWGISGVNSFTSVLVGQLNSMGYDASILFTRGRDTHFEDKLAVIPSVPFDFLDLDSSSPYPDNVWQAIAKYFKRHDPCVIVPNYDYTASCCSAILPAQVGIVGIAHSDDDEHYEHVYRLGSYWNRIVAVSDCISEKIFNHNPKFKEKTNIINYGIADLFVDTPVPSRAPLEKRAIRLVYSGRLVRRQKRIERYVDLVKELDLKEVDFVLDVIGDGEEMAWLEHEFASNIEDGSVVLHGRVDSEKLLTLVDRADVFVLLSDFEGLPISLLECMARGCVPVVYDMESGVDEVVINGENGFIVKDRSIVSTVETLKRLQDNDGLDEIRELARETIKAKGLTSVDMALSYSALFDEVFNELECESYVRPKPVAFGSRVAGIIPPAWLS